MYVVEFDRAIFPDADVNTAVTILEEETDAKKRGNNVVRFVRLKQRMDLKSQLELIRGNQGSEEERIRANSVSQRNLVTGKWNVLLRAPLVYQKIIRHNCIKKLSNIAIVLFGIKTGYNDFFVLSSEQVNEWRI